MKRCVVTGGAGFIGSHVAAALLQEGVEVLVIDNLFTGTELNFAAAAAVAPQKISLLRADIRESEARQAIAEFKPEGIFHLAAQMNVRASVQDPIFDASSNVLGTINMLEALSEAGGKFFATSSTGGAIYGEQSYFPADEEHPVHAECPYGVSKRCAEHYIEYFSRAKNFRGVALRFANVYGPRQNPKGEAGVVAIFSERILRGAELVINGTGEQTRDFVYVEDVVRACLLSVRDRTPKFLTYNVGTGRETSLNQLVSGMRVAWNDIRTPSDPEFSAVRNGPAMPGEQFRSVIAIDKINRELQWVPAISLEEGLRRTINSFR